MSSTVWRTPRRPAVSGLTPLPNSVNSATRIAFRFPPPSLSRTPVHENSSCLRRIRHFRRAPRARKNGERGPGRRARSGYDARSRAAARGRASRAGSRPDGRSRCQATRARARGRHQHRPSPARDAQWRRDEVRGEPPEGGDTAGCVRGGGGWAARARPEAPRVDDQDDPLLEQRRCIARAGLGWRRSAARNPAVCPLQVLRRRGRGRPLGRQGLRQATKPTGATRSGTSPTARRPSRSPGSITCSRATRS